jgi:hypothetical protein
MYYVLDFPNGPLHECRVLAFHSSRLQLKWCEDHASYLCGRHDAMFRLCKNHRAPARGPTSLFVYCPFCEKFHPDLIEYPCKKN